MSAQAVRAFMSIGEVLGQLQAEFPDVTVSKIRFLEGEGLIEPQRSPSGYRKFTYNDVERLRYILRAQRDQYLPLRVIKDQLDGQVARPQSVSDGPPAVRLSRDELIEAAGIDEETLAEMESFGLVAPVARRYDGEALEIARSVGALARFGLRARHLRAVRALVEREAGLIEQAVAPVLRRKATGAIAEADETAREMSGLLQELHNALLRSSVRGVLGQ
ncbi:MerR family transcriptional regulator [Microbispora amethystogenes]|uniref:MerR family transcriptional regulator n=1 Tax=Microbispora amethystogenes TaxID=1427754 RepID=A0ABQ4FIB2_9ACTN|nr:MerR family transcriptional regulator [Microbispora amethystogenes]GIH34566.1 MerR family transcriptional regulator [Microbispora amethystogenes]